ncbi:MAG: rhodanese-like domain-containing protein [Firmicutes bacterium]|nr:rhodanese-like domain-containing protein [Bacillota bacterium]
MRVRLAISVILVLTGILVLRAYEPRSAPPSVGPGELEATLRSGGKVVLIDVRPREHYLRSRIPGSHHTAAAEAIQAARRLARDPDEEIVIISETGREGVDLARQLQNAGFGRTKFLRGGIKAWKGPLAN